MRSGIFHLLLLLTFICRAKTVSGKDYAAYYRQTMIAEEAILNEQFDVALRHYQAAFEGYDFKFVRDVYIAAESAAFLRKDSITFVYLRYCMERGMKYDCLIKAKIFDEFLQTRYAKRLEAMQDECNKKYYVSIDTALNKEFTRRYEKEQRLKNIGGEEYYKAVEENLKRIQELLNAGMYPGEQTIGIFRSILSPRHELPGGNCFYRSGAALATLLNYSYAFDLLGDKLIKAMYAGQIHPQELAQVYIFSSGRICGYPKAKPESIKSLEQGPYAKLIFNLPAEKCPKIDTATANVNRAKWFIPRLGTEFRSADIQKNYGIATAIGDWAGGEK